MQACSLSTCRLHGSSLSTTKKRWVELEFIICTPSSHRPKLVIIPVTRTHLVMEHEIKKENKNDISNLFSGNCADRSFQGSEQIRFRTHCRKKVSLWVHYSPLIQAQPFILGIQTQLSSLKYFKMTITECKDCLIHLSLALFRIWTLRKHCKSVLWFWVNMILSVLVWSRDENGLETTNVHRRYEEKGPWKYSTTRVKTHNVREQIGAHMHSSTLRHADNDAHNNYFTLHPSNKKMKQYGAFP